MVDLKYWLNGSLILNEEKEVKDKTLLEDRKSTFLENRPEFKSQEDREKFRLGFLALMMKYTSLGEVKLKSANFKQMSLGMDLIVRGAGDIAAWTNSGESYGIYVKRCNRPKKEK